MPTISYQFRLLLTLTAIHYKNAITFGYFPFVYQACFKGPTVNIEVAYLEWIGFSYYFYKIKYSLTYTFLKIIVTSF